MKSITRSRLCYRRNCTRRLLWISNCFVSTVFGRLSQRIISLSVVTFGFSGYLLLFVLLLEASSFLTNGCGSQDCISALYLHRVISSSGEAWIPKELVIWPIGLILYLTVSWPAGNENKFTEIHPSARVYEWRLRPCLQGGRVTLARGLRDSPGLQAKFSGRVTLLPKTTLRLLRFGNLASKARTDNKIGK